MYIYIFIYLSIYLSIYIYISIYLYIGPMLRSCVAQMGAHGDIWCQKAWHRGEPLLSNMARTRTISSGYLPPGKAPKL